MQNTSNILLVEDHASDQILFRNAISEIDKNIMIRYAGNGREALDFLKRDVQLPELVYMDIQMPELNGIDCLRIMKSTNKFMHLPVVMLSASSEFEKIAFYLGAAAFIHKPGDYMVFCSQIKQTLQLNISDTRQSI